MNVNASIDMRFVVQSNPIGSQQLWNRKKNMGNNPMDRSGGSAAF